MPLFVINSDSDFNSKFSANSSKPIIVDFTASWCGPCKFIAPIFEELSNQYRSAIFLKVDVDQCSGTSQTYGVSAMPTFMAFVNGQKKETLQGANESGLREMCRKYASQVAWTGSGQRLSDAPTSTSTTYRSTATHASQPTQQAAPAAAGGPAIDVQIFEFLRQINEKLRSFGLNDFTIQGFVIQPYHIILALLSFIFMGPFGLVLTAAVIFFTQNNGSGAEATSQGSSNGGQPNPFRQPPSAHGGRSTGGAAFRGSGQRLGGN